MIVKNKLHRNISDSIVPLFPSLDQSSGDTDEGDDYEGISDETDILEKLEREMKAMGKSESEEQG